MTTPWQENRWPTAQELVSFIRTSMTDKALQSAGRLIEQAQRGSDCFLRDHEGRIEAQKVGLSNFVHDLNDLEDRLRVLIRDLDGHPEAVLIRRRLREILGDPEERGSFDWRTTPAERNLNAVTGEQAEQILRAAAGALPHHPSADAEEIWECEQPAPGIAFQVLEDEWSDDYRVRTVRQIQILGRPADG